MDRHLMEIIEDESDVHMKLPIAVIWVEESIHLLHMLIVSC